MVRHSKPIDRAQSDSQANPVIQSLGKSLDAYTSFVNFQINGPSWPPFLFPRPFKRFVDFSSKFAPTLSEELALASVCFAQCYLSMQCRTHFQPMPRTQSHNPHFLLFLTCNHHYLKVIFRFASFSCSSLSHKHCPCKIKSLARYQWTSKKA